MWTLSPTGKILIVGSRPSNFEDKWLKNPRLVFWHSTDKKASGKKKIPACVEIVIFTKFVSHSLSERIKAMARTAQANFFRYVQDTGEIKRILGEYRIDDLASSFVQPRTPEVQEHILDLPLKPTQGLVRPTPQILPVAEVITEIKAERKEGIMMKRGALREFVRDNADFSVSIAKEEIERLFQVAQERGLVTTLGSIGTNFYHQRNKTVRVQEGVTEKVTPKNIIRKVRGGRRDSAKAVLEFLSSAELVAVAMQEILEENNRLLAENTKLRDTLKQFRALVRNI